MASTQADLMDREEAAEYLGISPYTIAYRIRNRTLVPTAKYGNAHFFAKADLDAHVAEYPINARWSRLS